MRFKAIFLFFCTIFVASIAYCQDSTHRTIDILHAGLVSRHVQQFVLPQQTIAETTTPPPSVSVLSPNYYVTQLGFFCKAEINLEKAIKIPFKFRLGSVAQCDYLEGKNKVDR